jgi:Uma2 family endonuclease
MALPTLVLADGMTVKDLDDIDDDGRFYELSYGSLIVTPIPSIQHQSLLSAVIVCLGARLPSSMRLLPEADLLLGEDLVKRPDAMVVRSDQVGGQRVAGAPPLVVEILSPSTRALDLGEKRLVYSESAVPAYWLVDPDAETLTVLELEGREYTERGVLGVDDEHDVTLPFPMTVRGADIFIR